MPWHRCFIRGENFPTFLDGEHTLLGFYTTRFVEASGSEDAEQIALATLRGEPKLAPPEGVKPSGTFRVFFEEVREIPADRVPSQPPGFTFYPMDT